MDLNTYQCAQMDVPLRFPVGLYGDKYITQGIKSTHQFINFCGVDAGLYLNKSSST